MTTPAEVREVLVEVGRWWASRPEFAERARERIAFLEQLPEDHWLLFSIAGKYQDANHFRDGWFHEDFGMWNEACIRLEEFISKRYPDLPPRDAA